MTQLHPVIEEVFTYWKQKKQEKPFPYKEDIDPIEIPHLLPHLMLADVLYDCDPIDFRYRLLGEHVMGHSTLNVVGMTVSELIKQVPELMGLKTMCHQILDQKQPLNGEYHFHTTMGVYKKMQYVIMPLISKGKTEIDVIFGAVVFLNSH